MRMALISLLTAPASPSAQAVARVDAAASRAKCADARQRVTSSSLRGRAARAPREGRTRSSVGSPVTSSSCLAVRNSVRSSGPSGVLGCQLRRSPGPGGCDDELTGLGCAHRGQPGDATRAQSTAEPGDGLAHPGPGLLGVLWGISPVAEYELHLRIQGRTVRRARWGCGGRRSAAGLAWGVALGRDTSWHRAPPGADGIVRALLATLLTVVAGAVVFGVVTGSMWVAAGQERGAGRCRPAPRW